MADRAYLERLTKELADKGKLVEAGWVSLRLHCIPPNAPAAQLTEMRFAFMAGAQHVFSSMMDMLDPEPGETPADMRRMELLNAELEAFVAELKLWASRAEGNG
jgi:hypothetical protein